MRNRHNTNVMKCPGGPARWLIVWLTIVVAFPMSMAPVFAQTTVNNPPTRGTMTVYPETDSVTIEGVGSSQSITLQVLRNNRVIGKATIELQAGNQTLQVNRLGFEGSDQSQCWEGRTPNIRAGDDVQYTINQPAYKGIVQQTTTANLTTGRPFLDTTKNDLLTVKGTALKADGSPLPITQLELVVLHPNIAQSYPEGLVASGVEPPDLEDIHGLITRDAGGGPAAWIATFEVRRNAYFVERPSAADAGWVADTDNDKQAVLLMHWLGQNPNSERELTLLEDTLPALPGGPADFCIDSAPAGGGAVIGFSRGGVNIDDPVVNQASVGTELGIYGIAGSAIDNVQLTVGGVTPSITMSAGEVLADDNDNKAWSAAIPPGTLANAAEGKITVTAEFFDVNGNKKSSDTATFFKDTVAPAPPDASPASARFKKKQVVTLSAENGVEIRYTLDRAIPSSSSRLYSFPLRLRRTTMIKAVAIDDAGNPSTVGSFRYVKKKKK